MSIRKNNSRAADRVKIKRMHAQGYSTEQISGTLSITPEHVDYVLEKYEAALHQNQLSVREQKEIAGMREAEALARQRDPSIPAHAPPPPTIDMEALKAQLKAEIQVELANEAREQRALEKEAMQAEIVAPEEPEVTVAEEEFENPPEVESEAESEEEDEAPKPRRRRRQTAA